MQEYVEDFIDTAPESNRLLLPSGHASSDVRCFLGAIEDMQVKRELDPDTVAVEAYVGVILLADYLQVRGSRLHLSKDPSSVLALALSDATSAVRSTLPGAACCWH